MTTSKTDPERRPRRADPPTSMLQLTEQQTRIERGILSAKAGDWDVAERAFTDVIERYPAQWEAWVNRGNVRQERGDVDLAIHDFSAAVALGPRHVAPWFNRGNARAVLGDLDGAIHDYTAAIAVDPGFARAFERRARVHQRRGADDVAERDLSRAIELEPDKPDAYGNRAAIRALRGAVDLAITDCEGALGLLPRGSTKRDPIARLLSTLSREREGEVASTRRARRASHPAKPPDATTRRRDTAPQDLRAKFLRALDDIGLPYTTRRRKHGVAAVIDVDAGERIAIVLHEEARQLAFEATRETADHTTTWESASAITARASVPRLRAVVEQALETWRGRARKPRPSRRVTRAS